MSFVVALVHFITEVLVFKTMSIKGAATPMAIAGEGLVLFCSLNPCTTASTVGGELLVSWCRGTFDVGRRG